MHKKEKYFSKNKKLSYINVTSSKNIKVLYKKKDVI